MDKKNPSLALQACQTRTTSGRSGAGILASQLFAIACAYGLERTLRLRWYIDFIHSMPTD
jgi:hypothetical protein